MDIRPFNFGNALTYFAQGPGAAGFLWKYILGFGVTGFVATFTVTFSSRYVFAWFYQYAFSEWVWLLITFLAGVAFWSIHEAALQRHLVSGENYKLRIGRDEIRIMVVSLLISFLLGVLAGVLILIWLALVASSFASGSAGVVIFMFFTIAGFIWIFLAVAVKFCAASALTIRDNRVRLTKSFDVTGGKFWALMGALFLQSVGYLVFIVTVLGTVYTIASPFLLSSGSGIVMTTTVSLVMGFLYFCGLGLLPLMIGGPGALAAINDPNWDGFVDHDVEVFS